MVKHIVMFKLKDKTPDNVDSLVNALEGMVGKIDSLRFLEVGRDFKESERSFDVVLTTHFDDREGLESYARHPVHQPVIQLAREICHPTVVVDYEI
ncbi:Stress responsive alpha-beta barrel domain protein [Nitrospina gracilis 3/211]|uniref:Stress responsive alpha-beta barrel domain protein n=2 Tax=Nitrospina TaxID=35800 RepID=M1Z0S4_NITG3|nr:Dabb family protein [Nitrospina gracilis]CCQ91326.1 Stress responsive alpha-beta barrel domain protein [Nitrospina gracilis 3/211]